MIAAVVVAMLTGAVAIAAVSPTVSTDKADYGGIDTVQITGAGFDAGASLSVLVTAPDGTTQSGDGTGSAGPDAVSADGAGAFALAYQLSGTDAAGNPYFGQDDTYVVDVIDASGAVVASTTFTDTHFRFGHMTWAAVPGLANTVDITYTVGLRRNYPAWSPPLPNVGDTVNLGGTGRIFFGDGANTTPAYSIDFVDAAGNWFLASVTVRHTYAGPGPWTANNNSCCTISTLRGGQNDDAWRVQTVINIGDSAGSAVSALPVIVTCPVSGLCQFPIGAVQPDLHAVTYRLATAADSPTSPVNPPNTSIDATTGVYSFPTSLLPLAEQVAGRQWTTQVVIEDIGPAGELLSSSAIDFLIELVIPSIPPAFIAPTPPSGTTFGVGVGQTLTFPVQAADVDIELVSMDLIGLPTGATFPVPTPDNPVGSTFTWTPGIGDIRSHALVFRAADATTTVLHPININVSALTLTKTLSLVSGPNPPEDGITSEYDMTFTATLAAAAPSPLDSVSVTDTLGPDATFVSLGAVTQGVSSYTPPFDWAVGTLNPGQSESAILRISVTPGPGDVGLPLSVNLGATATGVDRGSGSPITTKSNALNTADVVPVSVPYCDGLPATIIGTPGDDNINGTPGNDVIVGLAGEDNIDGKGGNDVICGGPDHDQLEGGDGNDRIFGGDGPDRIWGQDGEDYIEGGADNDVVYGGDDNDEIHGNGGDDRLKGDNGDDRIFGDDGNDTVDGKSGEDYLDGGANDDRLYGGDDNDTMVGGDGYNVYYGGAGDDNMLGGADRDRMKGEAGTDTCNGGGGLLDSTEACEIVSNVP
jgi:hypothetical protein